jgi:hypothetical protein
MSLRPEARLLRGDEYLAFGAPLLGNIWSDQGHQASQVPFSVGRMWEGKRVNPNVRKAGKGDSSFHVTGDRHHSRNSSELAR